ncbi:hypothetical protein HKCCE2091_13805 [Rhodobacterales bacterium HKCCE2091]|nr:hypothetical protein [Rhodobacterales bacterium HKCCE2091]
MTFETFEDRCVLALTDPDAYFAMLEQEPDARTFPASSEDGSVRIALPSDMSSAENVSVVTAPDVQQRTCITGFYLSDNQDAMIDAFMAYVDGRADISITAGGYVPMTNHPLADLVPDLGFARYVVDGLALPDDAVVMVHVAPDAFEVEALYSVPTGQLGAGAMPVPAAEPSPVPGATIIPNPEVETADTAAEGQFLQLAPLDGQGTETQAVPEPAPAPTPPPTPAPAAIDPQTAAINMRLAATLCLENILDPVSMPDAFRAAGFTVVSGLDAGSYEATGPGVNAIMIGTGQGDGYCAIQSVLVNLATANAIGAAITEGRGFTPGSPEGQAGQPPGICDGFTNWNTRPVITLSYAGAGNSGECIDDGSSAIIIR